MASRQHSGQALHKTGKTPLGDGNTTAAREDADMAVWFMRRLQCLLCEESTLFHAEIATDAGSLREHQQTTVETTCCARENARMR
jgi:hypothetical protein